MNLIDISTIDYAEKEWFQSIKSFVFSILEILDIENWEISIVFCSKEKIQELNRDFRKKDYPTDVLSFPQEDFPHGDEQYFYAGDIVISLEIAEKNCIEFNEVLETEVKRLLIHGILHLNGYDHETNNSDEEMLVLQENILDKLRGVKIF